MAEGGRDQEVNNNLSRYQEEKQMQSKDIDTTDQGLPELPTGDGFAQSFGNRGHASHAGQVYTHNSSTDLKKPLDDAPPLSSLNSLDLPEPVRDIAHQASADGPSGQFSSPLSDGASSDGDRARSRSERQLRKSSNDETGAAIDGSSLSGASCQSAGSEAEGVEKPKNDLSAGKPPQLAAASGACCYCNGSITMDSRNIPPSRIGSAPSSAEDNTGSGSLSYSINPSGNTHLIRLRKPVLDWIRKKLDVPNGNNWEALADLYDWKYEDIMAHHNESRLCQRSPFLGLLETETFVAYTVDKFVEDMKQIKRLDVVKEFGSVLQKSNASM